MATLRLFAQAREAAGVGSVELDGNTVGDIVAEAVRRFGSGFAEVVDGSRVWCNGEPAADADPVGEQDEVAVLPPVSGG